MTDTYVKRALRELAKIIIWQYASWHRQDMNKKNICIFASRRSGSTLLMQILAANRGVTFSDQPFSLFTASSENLNKLPICESGQIISPDSEERALLREYIAGVFDGQIKANMPWKIFSKDYSYISDRIVMKITAAKSIIGWIDEQFDVETVILTRHPIAQALSVLRNQWLPTHKAFLRNQIYVDTYLDSAQLKFCWRLKSVGSDLEKRVLDWCLENLPMIRLMDVRPKWLYVSYEDLVRNTEMILKMLALQLDLKNIDQMCKKADAPSRSTRVGSTLSTRRKIQLQDADYLTERWKIKVSDSEEAACFEILGTLNIDLYTLGSFTPTRASGLLGRDILK